MSGLNAVKVRAMASEVEDALKSVAAKHNGAITLGNVSYGAAEFRVRITFQVPDADGEIKDAKKEAYEQMAKELRLKPLHDSFVSGNRTFVITGWNPRARKYPVLAKEVLSGAVYKFPETAVQLQK